MSTIARAVEAFVAQTGCDEAELIELLCTYIDRQDDPDAFCDFLAAVAEDYEEDHEKE